MYRAIEAGIRADALAVCVRHKGAHVWTLDHIGEDRLPVGWCHALPAQRTRWERYLTSRDPTPEPAPAIRVEIDEERLAAAIVAASRATREERRTDAPRPPQAAPAASAPPDTSSGILDRYTE